MKIYNCNYWFFFFSLLFIRPIIGINRSKTLYAKRTSFSDRHSTHTFKLADGASSWRNNPFFLLIHIISIQNDFVLVRNLSNDKISSLTDQNVYNRYPCEYNIRWPETLDEGPDRSICITASHIQEPVFFRSSTA
jgi:hypothetical protein